jgi:hypothetical protein
MMAGAMQDPAMQQYAKDKGKDMNDPAMQQYAKDKGKDLV